MTETTVAPAKSNGPKDFVAFFNAPAFSGPSPECTLKDFREFWASCSEAEKAEFRAAKLS
jgi:hypothetical protein